MCHMLFELLGNTVMKNKFKTSCLVELRQYLSRDSNLVKKIKVNQKIKNAFRKMEYIVHHFEKRTIPNVFKTAHRPGYQMAPRSVS